MDLDGGGDSVFLLGLLDGVGRLVVLILFRGLDLLGLLLLLGGFVGLFAGAVPAETDVAFASGGVVNLD